MTTANIPLFGSPAAYFRVTQVATDSSGNPVYALNTTTDADSPTVTTLGHGTAAAATRVELPTDGTGKVGLNAGTALIGSVSPIAGITASATFTPAAAAYGAGDVMDAAKEFAFTYASGTAVPVGSLIRILTCIVKIDITSVPAGQTSYSLPLYNATQPSAQTDNDAWTLVSGDLSAYRGTVSLGTPVDLGSCLYIKTQYVDFDIPLLSSSSSLWGRLVTDGAHTAAAVARTVLLYGIVL